MKVATPFAALPTWRRVFFGAGVGVVGMSLPILVLLGMTLTGSRYQRLGRVADTETDMWVLSVVYPVGFALAGALVGALAPAVRRQWHAALLGAVAAVPVFALISVAQDPRGPRPYGVNWPVSLGLAVSLGGLVGAAVFGELPKAIARRWQARRNAADV